MAHKGGFLDKRLGKACPLLCPGSSEKGLEVFDLRPKKVVRKDQVLHIVQSDFFGLQRVKAGQCVDTALFFFLSYMSYESLDEV